MVSTIEKKMVSGALGLANDAVTLAKLGITPKIPIRKQFSGGATTTIALTNRVVESEYRDGGWIKVFRNGQRMEWKSSGASDKQPISKFSDNGSATSIVAGAAFEDGDVIFIDFMY